MLTKLIATIKSKAAWILCVILATTLTIKSVELNRLKGVDVKLKEQSSLNERLVKEKESLSEELKTKPKEFITITKEVTKEICSGVVKQEAIKALPSRKEVTSEKGTADIDDRLPADLIQLLK